MNAAGALASEGGWLTPRVQGRFLLYKPPLATWLAGLSARLLGRSPFAFRLPALLAATAATVLLFTWACRTGSILSGCLVAALILSNPLWHTFARLCYTDMLFVACLTGAIFFVHLDPKFARTTTIIGFGLLTAGGVMTKNAAGILPLLVLALYCVITPRADRPAPGRVGMAIAIAAGAAAPWHIYQAVIHPDWFWADYVQMQILGFGLNPPAQSSAETALVFYGRRVALIDPALLIFAAIATPAAFVGKRPDRKLVFCWIVVTVLALLAFRYRNLPYALALVPPLALLGGLHTPFPRIAAVLAAGLFIVKSMSPAQPWGLSFGAPPRIEAARHLRSYSQLGRPNGLILVQSDDELHSLSLPFHARYAFIDPDGVSRRYAPHYVWLGITMSVDEFLALDRLRPQFENRLQSWGLNSTEPLATSILANDTSDVSRLISRSPRTDFYAPDFYRDAASATHDFVAAGPGRCFLLARSSAD